MVEALSIYIDAYSGIFIIYTVEALGLDGFNPNFLENEHFKSVSCGCILLKISKLKLIFVV